MRSTPHRPFLFTFGAFLGALLLSGCVRHYHHGSHHPRTIVVERPSRTVIVKKPSRTVVVEKPSPTVVIERPSRPVVVEKPTHTVVAEKPSRPVVMEKQGPPPAAPANGHRHRHQGADLRFDSGLGVYVVLGRRDHYFHGARFYRYVDGSWLASATLNGSWVAVDMNALPPKLRARHAGKHREKGSHPAKHPR